MTEYVQVPVSLIERIQETTQALQHMPILQAGSAIPDVTFNLNVVTEHFNAVHAAVADVTALLLQPTLTAEPCGECRHDMSEHGGRWGCTNGWKGTDGWGCPCGVVQAAAPPRIEDMAPGTTFECVGRQWMVMAPHVISADRRDLIPIDEFDPFTIRDVTPPKDAA